MSLQDWFTYPEGIGLAPWEIALYACVYGAIAIMLVGMLLRDRRRRGRR